MKFFNFKYGDESLQIPISESNLLQELQSNEINPIENLEVEINKCLDQPIASPPFNEIFQAGDQVTIIISDITRLWAKTHLYLPYVIKRLNKLGIPDDNIIILIATGTHREETEEEKALLVGRELYQRIQVIEHNCNTSPMVSIGTSSRGTEVILNELVVNRKLILTGGIVHHLMAGFGGGRKSIVPGVASKKTIAQNHLHALDPKEKHSNPLIGVGITENNPLHLDMLECARLAKPDFLINSIVDTNGNLAKLFAGDWLKAWQEGCQWADEKFGVPIKEKADLVIASCGGYPKDISLYQSTKTLFNASQAVKPGGTILLLAECRDGAGADAFFGWSKPLKEGKLDEELRKNFTIPGYIFYAAVESAQKSRVILLSSIKKELVEPMGIIATNSLEEAITLIDLQNKDQKIILMPYGGATIPISK